MIAKCLLIAGLCAVASLNKVDADCGGTTQNINSSKVLPGVVTEGLECVWFFKQDKNASMYIFVREFHIQPGDTFTVYNGAPSDGVNVDKIVTLAGSADPSVVIFAAQTRVQLTFKSGPVQTNATRSFQVSYSTTGCDVKLNAYRSAIAAPIYLQQPGSVNCTYDISSDHNASVALSFSKLAISKGSVIVWDGEGKQSDPVINYTNPTYAAEDVISRQGKLTMQVVFSTARANQTMNAGFETGHECTKTIVVNGSMTLSSPGYPSKYYSHQHCRWILKVPKEKSNYNIKAKFADLDLGSPYDYVVVNAGGSRSSPPLGFFRQGSSLDTVMASGNGMMYIELGTDETPGAKGFQIALMLSPFDQAFFGSGHIELSPKINLTAEETHQARSSKADDDDIFYHLIAEEGKQVEVSINVTTVIFPTSVIRIYDGSTPSNPLLARIRSDTPLFTVQSSGRNVLILLSGFKRNGTMTGQKFAADFKSVQQGTINSLSDMSGTLELDTTSATTNKTWLINTYESTNQVALRIHSLDLNPGEILNIYDGFTTTTADNKIATLTNDVTNLPVVYAKKMRVEYITQTKFNSLHENVTASPVLSASYEQIAGKCGGDVSGSSGIITTPEWPNRYPYNAECSWVFQPVQNSTLHLSFESFTLFELHTLIITVQDFHTYTNKTNFTSIVVANVTGEDVPSDFMFNMDDVNITSRQVMVNFSSKYHQVDKSRSAQVGAGFQMKYEYLNSNCSMNVTAGSNIKTPNWPNAVTTNLSCLWIISEPPLDEKVNTTVNVLSYTLELQHVTLDNSSNLLEIHDGGAMNSPLVPVTLTDGKTKSMQSRTNKLWIKYNYTKLNSTKQGFALRLTFKKQGCPLKKQCANGICMQDSWKCDGVDNCGDMSDEKGCTGSRNGGKKQYSGLVLGMSIFATMVLTLILVIVVPIIYRRIRYPNYSELRDLMAPVPS